MLRSKHFIPYFGVWFGLPILGNCAMLNFTSDLCKTDLLFTIIDVFSVKIWLTCPIKIQPFQLG